MVNSGYHPMKVEFMTKFGLVAEYAALKKVPLLLMLSAEFAQSEEWAFLDDVTDDSQSFLGTMLMTTGMVVAEFETLADIDTWIGAVQSRLPENAPRLVIATFDDEGRILEEGSLTSFPTTFTISQQKDINNGK